MKRDASTTILSHADNVVPLGPVPKVRLYVERTREDNWSVHVGHVTDRGRWRTAPHAHPRYDQLIFVRNGRGVMNLEGRSVRFEGPCTLLLPAECIHGLDYETDVDRWVVTIEAAYLAQVNGKLPEFVRLWEAPRVIPLGQAPDIPATFCDLIKKLDREIRDETVGHVIEKEALLTLLLLTLVRGASLDRMNTGSASRNELRLVERFRELIDKHYCDNLPLQDYVSLLAVSLAQLRCACASVAGQSPTKMIHSRIVTEAKRSLIFGDQSVEQIAFSLGFAHPSYFTRFFGKEVGQTPGQFRIGARAGLTHDN
jgi:AraC family transcriptional activator of pobA